MHGDLFRRGTRGVSVLVCLAVGLFFLESPAPGQSLRTWTNSAGGDFSVDSNWSGGPAPTASETAVFELAGPYTVTFDQPSTDSDKLRVDSGELTFDFADPTYTHVVGSTTSLDPGLRIGFPTKTPAPKLTLTGGGTLNAGHAIVGHDALGELIVKGPGTKLQATRSGQGLTVGHGATGRMTIREGGEADLNKVLLGASSNGQAGFGEVLVTDPDSTWDANRIDFVFGEMTIQNGASVATQLGSLDNGSRLTVKGKESQFTADSSLAGNAFTLRDGWLDVIDGGEVLLRDNEHYFANDGGSHQTVVTIAGVDGDGVASRLYDRNLVMGSNVGGGTGGKSFMEVADGGRVETFLGAALSTFSAKGIRSILHVHGAGSVFEVTRNHASATIAIAGSTQANTDGADAYVTVADGGTIRTHTSSDGVIVWNAGHLSGDGTIDADVTNHGYLSPSMRYRHKEGQSSNIRVLDAARGPVSALTISGDFAQQPGGVLEMLLDAADHDRLLIAGDAALAGTLDLTAASGFAPAAGAMYELLDVDGVLSGQFAGLPEGELVETIDGVDLFITYAADDGNDVALYTAVPEPASIALITLGGVAMLRRRR